MHHPCGSILLRQARTHHRVTRLTLAARLSDAPVALGPLALSRWVAVMSVLSGRSCGGYRPDNFPGRRIVVFLICIVLGVAVAAVSAFGRRQARIHAEMRDIQEGR